jgi:hypothetical protein
VQKSDALVRHVVGDYRFEVLKTATARARLCSVLRRFVNFLQPSFGLAEKTANGAKLRKRYHLPAAPYRRLLVGPRASDELRRRGEAMNSMLHSLRLPRELRWAQQQPVEIADCVAGQ